MAVIKKETRKKEMSVGDDVEKLGPCALLLGCKTVQPLLENSAAAPQKLNIVLPQDPAMLLLGIYPKELKAGTRTDVCTPKFIAALVTIAKR